jgi:hypothetical protein
MTDKKLTLKKIEKAEKKNKTSVNKTNNNAKLLEEIVAIRKDLKQSPKVCSYGEKCTLAGCKHAHPAGRMATVRDVNNAISKVRLVKSADPDKPIVCRYMASLIDPMNVDQVSIPDSLLIPHVQKNVVTTFNVVLPTTATEGLFVFFPGNPSLLVGFNYYKTASGWQYDSTTGVINISQDITASYDYGRKVSQVVKGQVTTLAAGVYAISGTFNMIYAYSTVSEFTNLSYATMLGQVSNVCDKVGNVPVNKGFAVLSPPMMNQTYVRLNDQTPITAAIGSMLDASIVDNSQNLVYTLSGTPYIGAVATGTNCFDVTFNADIVDCSYLDGSMTILMPTVTGLTQGSFTILLSAYGPHGENIGGSKIVSSNAVIGYAVGAGTVTIAFNHVLSIGNYNSPNSAYGPISIAGFGMICSVRLSCQFQGAAAVTITNGTFNARLTVPNAARYGEQNNVALVAYQNISSGSTISVTVSSNFELIPNSTLRPNINTTTAHYEPQIMDMVRQMYARSAQLGMRVVWTLEDYDMAVPQMMEHAVLNREGVSAQAADWAGWMRKMKTTVLPALLNAVPEARIAYDAGSALWKRLLPSVKAASGYTRASDLRRIVKRPRMMSESSVNILVEPLQIVLTPKSAVKFPVVQEVAGVIARIDTYVAVLGDYSKFTDMPSKFVTMPSGKRVYGWMDTVPNVDVPYDVTLLPVQVNGDQLILSDGYMVSQHSCELAISMCVLVTGVPLPYYTGVVVNGLVGRVGDLDQKKLYVNALGASLISSFDVSTIGEALMTVKMPYKRLRIVGANCRSSMRVPDAISKATDYDYDDNMELVETSHTSVISRFNERYMQRYRTSPVLIWRTSSEGNSLKFELSVDFGLIRIKVSGAPSKQKALILMSLKSSYLVEPASDYVKLDRERLDDIFVRILMSSSGTYTIIDADMYDRFSSHDENTVVFYTSNDAPRLGAIKVADVSQAITDLLVYCAMSSMNMQTTLVVYASHELKRVVCSLRNLGYMVDHRTKAD